MAVQISGNDITVPRDTTVTRNLTVGGVLTYEDVTNVDSVGLITARSGIKVTSGDIAMDTAGNITLGDSGSSSDDRLVFGASSDLSIYHNGSGSYIDDSGAGALYIRGSDLYLTDEDGTNMLYAANNAGVSLYYGGGAKLQTTSSGVEFLGGLFLNNPTNAGKDINWDTSNNHFEFYDSVAATFGTDNDLEVYHNGSNAYIKNGTGQLLLRSGTHTFENAAGSTEYARINSSGRLLIGKTSGTAKVDVDATDSTIRVTKAAASNYCGFQLDRDNSSNAGGYLGLAGSAGHYINNSVQHDLCLRSESNLLFSSSGNTEKARIDTSGRLLVGTENPINTSTSKFQIAANDATGSAILARFSASGYSSYLDFYKSRSNTLGTAYVVNDDDHLGAFRFYAADGGNSGYITAAEIYGSCDGGSGSAGDMPGRITFHTRADGAGQGMSERYRIHNNGKHSWNNTTFPYGETFHFYNGLEGSCASFYQNSTNDHTNIILRHGRGLSGYTGYQMLFKRNDNTNVGSITSGASSTSFNTSSDYRLKENQIAIPNAIDKLNKLKPYEFNFKDDPDYKYLGFFAHEVQEIIPNGVACGEKDEVYTEDSPSEADDYKKGDMKIQSLDYGKLTPLLTAALQEAVTEIESLKSRLNAAGL